MHHVRWVARPSQKDADVATAAERRAPRRVLRRRRHALKTSRWRSAPARSSPSSGPTGRARRRCCGRSPARSATTAARSPAAPSGSRASTSPGWTPPPSSAGAWCRCPRGGGCSATSPSRRTCAPAATPCATRRPAPRRGTGCSTCSRSSPSGGPAGGLLSGGQQQMLAMGRALMASPKLLLLDEPSLGLAPLLVDQIGEIVTEINRQGTAVLLIEQNAVDGPAGRRRAPTSSRSATSPPPAAPTSSRPATTCGSATWASPSRCVADRRGRVTEPDDPDRASPRAAAVENLTVRFGGVAALSDVSLRRRARHRARAHRAERRRQVHLHQRAGRGLPGHRGAGHLRRGGTHRAARPPGGRPGRGPHLPEHLARARGHRRGQPAGRPAPA